MTGSSFTFQSTHLVFIQPCAMMINGEGLHSTNPSRSKEFLISGKNILWNYTGWSKMLRLARNSCGHQFSLHVSFLFLCSTVLFGKNSNQIDFGAKNKKQTNKKRQVAACTCNTSKEVYSTHTETNKIYWEWKNPKWQTRWRYK